ncbi:HNH endonuclease [Candidatus Parabeggiatoa sp. HSG14]|uniref:HNH endonuclease n=1 Tax=Candidatus Parabeggiatoa sp. HSG14 TaxID=3055593 RepID=UPI0025A7630C|nr:HNH endonuclease [Thiotrichales bacterium HSG14]
MNSTKKCKGCNSTKSIESFVTIYGYVNPRGKYCIDCFHKHQQEHASSLMDGRDFCLYCGAKISKAYDWHPNGKSKKCYIHSDHMDPLAIGGIDDESNIVGCCAKCNLEKNDTPFTQWLDMIPPQMKNIAREIYFLKHGATPEDFYPS